MSRTVISVAAAAALVSSTATADVPNVAVDIAPIHSLVARVMQGLGTPNLIIQQGASPHEYNLRPSEAKALQDSNLVFWMGEGLTPWMEDALETLSSDEKIITLLKEEKTSLLEFREGALFEEHDHGEHGNKEHVEKEDHGDHNDHGDEEHDAKDDHDDHGHGEHDPHAWLSLDNADIWFNVIAAQLSGSDPENARTYFANAAVARAENVVLKAEINTMLNPVKGHNFIVFHDAYQYFEKTFDFPASGAISLGDASDPSPARIAEIQDRVRDEGINCVLAEPQFNKGLVVTILEGSDAKTGVIDPLGVALEAGPELYPQLIRNMAKTLIGCL
ncbi:MAG: zinc ABC transporter substrate-binding protein [Paracoccaceae bacterium]|nr:zinc ABC transporter substrate-binding protein [Paracoccaceae bacterium]